MTRAGSQRHSKKKTQLSMPVTAQSEAWVCGHSLAGIVGSNPAGGMGDCLLWVLCVVRQKSLRRADHSSRGVLPNVVCLSVIVNSRQWGGLGPLGLLHRGKKKTTQSMDMNVYVKVLINYHNSEIISLWEENLKKNIWAHKRKPSMESQNQWRIRQADKT